MLLTESNAADVTVSVVSLIVVSVFMIVFAVIGIRALRRQFRVLDSLEESMRRIAAAIETIAHRSPPA